VITIYNASDLVFVTYDNYLICHIVKLLPLIESSQVTIIATVSYALISLIRC